MDQREEKKKAAATKEDGVEADSEKTKNIL